MRSWRSLCTGSAHFCLGCVFSFMLWGLWTLLAFTLLVEVWIACSHELNVPEPFLRMLERRFSVPGLSVKLGKVVFDPSGHLIVRDYSLVLNSFNEPILKGSLLHTRIDPWGLLAGDAKAHQLEFSGVELYLPTPVSPTGKPEAFVSNLDAVISSRGREIFISNLTAQCGSIILSANGSFYTTPWRNPTRDQTVSSEEIAVRTIGFLHGISKYYPKVDALKGGRIDLALSPSESRGAIVDVSVIADSFHLQTPYEFETGPFVVSGHFPVAGDSPVMTRLAASVDYIASPQGRVDDLSLRVRGIFRPGTPSFDLQDAGLSAARVAAKDIEVMAPSLRLDPSGLPAIRFRLVGGVADTVVSVSGHADLKEKSATLHAAVKPSQNLVDFAAKLAGKNLRKYALLTDPVTLEADAEFAPGLKLTKASAWFAGGNLDAYNVPILYAEGAATWDGRHLLASDVLLRQGDNVARGSYEMDAVTRDYRFLLTGKLQPMDISPWFKEWWPTLWSYFEFRGPKPDADADILGRWGSPNLSKVFVGVDAEKASIRSVYFERARTQMFIMNHFTHALWLHAMRPEGEARGWFARLYNQDAGAWQQIDFDIESTMDPKESANLFPPVGPEIVAPFYFAKAPHLTAHGTIEGPGSPRGEVHTVDFNIDSSGAFQLQGFPVDDMRCSGHWENDLLYLNDVKARFAQGDIEGKAVVTLKEPDKHIKFEGSLKGAKLGDAINTVEAYTEKQAKARGEIVPPTPAQPASPKKNGLEKVLDARLDATVAAEGPYSLPIRYYGSGQATISGPELGQVRVLGMLSELFRFTTLRFTTIKANFNLKGPEVEFPNVRIYGATSAIEGHGRYVIDTKGLDFNAKVWPFAERPSLLQGALGLVLAPFSHVFEVKLQGTAGNPSWSLANNPFRSRNAQENAEQPKENEAPPPAPKN